MAGTSRLSIRASADFPVPGVKLTQFQARLLESISPRAKAGQVFLGTTESFADHLGVSRRYAQLGLKALVKAGRISIERKWPGILLITIAKEGGDA